MNNKISLSSSSTNKINKMNVSSFAHKYGILLGKQNNNPSKIGLNPNLNLEDEYVENLLKQIHFMNMQIKLLKEKKQQSQGNALWGIINRTKQPLIKNIIDSSQKYQQMKNNIDKENNNNLQQKFKQNQNYLKVCSQKEKIKEEMIKLENSIGTATFNLIELDQSIKLAEIETQKEIIKRKNHTEELQAMKVMVQEIILLNFGRNSKEIENRKRQSTEIQKVQYLTKKLQQQLSDVKVKINKSDQTVGNLRNQIHLLENQHSKGKSEKQRIENIVQGLVKNNQSEQKILRKLESEIRIYQAQYYKAKDEEINLTLQLQHLQKEVHYFQGHRQYLQQYLNQKQSIDQSKLQQLQKVVQKNKDLNETVNLLTQKWEQIKHFSKV